MCVYNVYQYTCMYYCLYCVLHSQFVFDFSALLISRIRERLPENLELMVDKNNVSVVNT